MEAGSSYMMHLISLFATLSSQSALAASCPDDVGWIQAGNSCFLVTVDNMDWFSAQEVCTSSFCEERLSSDPFLL